MSEFKNFEPPTQEVIVDLPYEGVTHPHIQERPSLQGKTSLQGRSSLQGRPSASLHIGAPVDNSIAIEFQHRSASLTIAKADVSGAFVTDADAALAKNVSEAIKEAKAIKKKKLRIDPLKTKELKADLQVTYHQVSEEEVLQLYNSNRKGLSEAEAAMRLKRDGGNTLAVNKWWKWIPRVIGYFVTGFCGIFWAAAILCFLCWQPLGSIPPATPDITNLGVSIVLVLVIFAQAGFTAAQDFKSMKVMNSITKMLPHFATVFRNGNFREIPVAQLVVGDIVQVGVGSKTPADLRVLEVNGMKVDNSILTGESEPINLTTTMTSDNYMESKNVMFMGTSVIEGSGLAVVVNTGRRTVMGQIARMSNATGGSTPLRNEINYFSLLICGLALCTGFIIIVVWLAWLSKAYPLYMNLSNILVTLIGAIVAFVPSGLPVSVTLTLTAIAKKMYEENVLVKNLPTVETLGSVSIIASDKTGTLTQNKMSVIHVFTGLKAYTAGDEFRKEFDKGNPCFTEMVLITSLCNRAVFDETSANLPLLQRKIIGDASDTAMLLFSESLWKVSAQRDAFPKLAEIPFNSKNKWMLSIVNKNNKCYLMMKGAAEMMIDRCVTILNEDGHETPITEEIKNTLLKQQEEYSKSGERVLATCRLYLDEETYPVTYPFDVESKNFPLDGLCFVGLIALIDPPKLDVPDVVARCRTAGIKVMMVTGDHHNTAAAIGRMVNIFTRDTVVTMTRDLAYQELAMLKPDRKELIASRSIAVRGPDIAAFDNKVWSHVLKHDEIVFARTSPENKLKIVAECQKRGHIVAVTGDGVNDSPALKQANVGVAMGSGSDIAKESADLILLDSNFSSLIAGIRNGRIVFDNLKKVVLYLLPAGSFSELTPILAYVFFGLPLPLSTFLMIVIAVGTDMFPSLALIGEQGESDLMVRLPRSKTQEKLVNPQLLFHAYFLIGLIESTTAFTMYFWYMYSYGGFTVKDLIFLFGGWTDGFGGKTQAELNELNYTAQSVFFVAIVCMQIGNLCATRTRKLSFFQQLPFSGKAKNLSLFAAMGASLCIAVFIVYLPGINQIFNTRPVPVQFWFVPFVFALFLFAFDECRKFIVRLVPWDIARTVAW